MIQAAFRYGPEIRYRSFDSVEHVLESLEILGVKVVNLWTGKFMYPINPTKHGIDDLLKENDATS